MYWNGIITGGLECASGLNSNIRCIEMFPQDDEIEVWVCWIVTLDVLKWKQYAFPCGGCVVE